MSFPFRYTRQVIDETLRAAVVAPWGARVYEYDLQVDEFVIPKEVCTVLFPGTLFKLVHWLGMESNNCYCSWPLIWDNTESNNPRKANVLSRLVALTSHKVSHERLDTLSRAPNLISDSLVWCDTALATCLDTLRSYDGGCNWMAWCKNWPKWLFRVKFFFNSKVPEFLHVLSNLRVVEKHSPVSFLAEMLLFRFVAFIVHAFIFCLRFSQKQGANQPKKYRGMFYYLIKKHRHAQNSGTFEGKKIHPRKSLKSVLHHWPSHSIVKNLWQESSWVIVVRRWLCNWVVSCWLCSI